ncbi:MAG: class I SAM-dependent methyltransferase [Anaerolineales bacterium]|nr:class I SAM-dependent methyltransferase [Anaerolineales bacterium]MCS7247116.1 class I SAM-dependent methyltransferase [Anaerolineales bacterium]MDW8160927.1 class I SAM-dependent methyltransferase [Anaerolineales bacterium]MDW8447588.1 class I SAM-dependent methyltransferase [Anaerolineales bacterium]
MVPKVVLKAGKEKSVLRRHPWVFAGAIREVQGEVQPGEAVAVYSHQGEWLAWGTYNPYSQICVRLWSWNEDEPIGLELLRQRLEKAICLRQSLMLSQETNCVRLVHGESDGIPGLIVDRYDDYLVIQMLHWGIETLKEALVQELIHLTHIPNVFERSEDEPRKLEGLEERKGVLAGTDPPRTLHILENGIHYQVDLRRGQKTGFYLDQRLNRLRVRHYASGRVVLDCFSYSGGMAIPALVGGARHVTCIDESSEALELLKANLRLNQIAEEKVQIQRGDVFQVLRQFRDRGVRFEMIILDPPKFAPTVAHVGKASRGYKDINLMALKLLCKGGILVTFSCSGGVDLALFKKIVLAAALDAGREVRILEHLHQAPDHPVSLYFPEGEYLKGLVLVVE